MKTLEQMTVAERKALPYNHPAINAYAEKVNAQYKLPDGIINALKNEGERSASTGKMSVSHAGAKGVMQLMPVNIKQFKVIDPFDPLQSIDGAGRYLQATAKQYKNDPVKMTIDYNGGPAQVNKFMAGKPMAKETAAYLSRVQKVTTPVAQTQTPAQKLVSTVAPTPVPVATPVVPMDAPVAASIAAMTAPQMPSGDVPESSWAAQVAALQTAAGDTEQAPEAADITPWEQRLMETAVSTEADIARRKALSSFFGEDYVPQVQLPRSIDESINRYLAKLT